MSKKSLTEEFPGTVIGVLSKSDKNFKEKLASLIKEAERLANRPTFEVLKEKMEIYGTAVSCCNENGYVCEGNIVEILPWGAEFIDPKWKDATIIVRDHESGEYSNWRPDFVTFIGYKREGFDASEVQDNYDYCK